MAQALSLEGFLTSVQSRDPHQVEFAQAVREVMSTLWPFLENNPQYRQRGAARTSGRAGARDSVPRCLGG